MTPTRWRRWPRARAASGSSTAMGAPYNASSRRHPRPPARLGPMASIPSRGRPTATLSPTPSRNPSATHATGRPRASSRMVSGWSATTEAPRACSRPTHAWVSTASAACPTPTMGTPSPPPPTRGGVWATSRSMRQPGGRRCSPDRSAPRMTPSSPRPRPGWLIWQ